METPRFAAEQMQFCLENSCGWCRVFPSIKAPLYCSVPQQRKLLLAFGEMLRSTSTCLCDLWQLGQPSVQGFK